MKKYVYWILVLHIDGGMKPKPKGPSKVRAGTRTQDLIDPKTLVTTRMRFWSLSYCCDLNLSISTDR